MKWPIRMFASETYGIDGKPFLYVHAANEPNSTPVLIWPADQAPEPVAWRHRASAFSWRVELTPSPQWVQDLLGFEEEPLYVAPPDLAKELAEVRAENEILDAEASSLSVLLEGVQNMLNAERARAETAEAALCELVRLKDMKDVSEITVSEQDRGALLYLYEQAKPKAWEAARKIAAAIRNSRGDVDE